MAENESDEEEGDLDLLELKRPTLSKVPTFLKGYSGRTSLLSADDQSDEEMEVPEVDYTHERITFIPCNEPVELLRKCYIKLHSSEDGGDEFLNSMTPSSTCTYSFLSPEETGFVPWKRKNLLPNGTHGADMPRGRSIWINPKGGDTKRRILFLHGGGYQWYSSDGCYQIFSSHIAAACHYPVFNIDYRLCPEHHFPSPVEDAIQAIQFLWENGPDGPSVASEIIIMGDSAGGGLAYSACIYWRDRYRKLIREIYELKELLQKKSDSQDLKEISERIAEKEAFIPKWSLNRMPSKIVSFSPWLDINLVPYAQAKATAWNPVTYEGDPCSYTDPKVNNESRVQLGTAYSPEKDFNNPLLSPIFDCMEDLPPSIIIAGAREMFTFECAAFVEKCLNAHYYSFEAMWHDFIMYPHACGESEKILDTVAKAMKIMAEFTTHV